MTATTAVSAVLHPVIRRGSRVARVTAGVCLLAAAVMLPRTSQAQNSAAPVRARVSGVAFDSVLMKPLVGAIMQLVPANDPSKLRSTTTGDNGAYAFDSVAVGTYVLGFLHPRLDSLGLQVPLTRVDIATSGEVRAPVAIPSGRTLVRAICGDSVARDSVGLFMGFVRNAKGEPLSGPARVRTQWTVVTLSSRGVERSAPNHVSPATPQGAFAICGVPIDGPFTARAFAGRDSSGTVELLVPPGRLLYRDMLVGSATRIAASAELRAVATGASSVLRGNGMLRGTVRSNTGRPIRGARITMWGSGRVDSTNASGQFVMQSLPVGTYTIEARALGFLPRRALVDIPDGREGVTEVALDVFVPTIDTVRVKANRGFQLEEEFEQRKKTGQGYYIDDNAMEKRRAMYVADALRGVPGVSIQPGDIGGDRVLMRGLAGTGSCVPSIFLNGLPVVSDNGVIDDIVNPQNVRAMEVYSRTGSTPSQFASRNGCGSIVIWTGTRRLTQPSP